VTVAPETLERVDMVLRREQSIVLTLTLDGMPLPQEAVGGLIQPLLLNANGVSVGGSTALGAGRFRLGPAPPGQYRIKVVSSVAYAQLFPNVRCAGDCTAELPQSGLVTVVDDQTDPQVSMDLRRLPRISGRVSADGSGLPAVGVEVRAIPTSPFASSFASMTDVDGQYTIARVPPGTYILHFVSSLHVDELHDNLRCESSSPLVECPGATLLSIGLDAPDRVVDAALSRSGRIAGRMTSGGRPLANRFGPLALLASSGAQRRIIGIATDDDGRYVADDVTTGTSLVALRADSQSVVPLIWRGIECPSAAFGGAWTACALDQAEPIAIAAGELRAGIDFDLRANGSQRVRVLGTKNGQPLAGVIVDVWDANGLRVDTRTTGSDGRAYPTVPQTVSAPYALSTDNDRGLINEVWQDIPCPAGSVFFGSCALTGFTPVTLPAAANAPEIVWSLGRSLPLFADGFEP